MICVFGCLCVTHCYKRKKNNDLTNLNYGHFTTIKVEGNLAGYLLYNNNNYYCLWTVMYL